MCCWIDRFVPTELDFLDYGESGLQVHSSLLNVVLHD